MVAVAAVAARRSALAEAAEIRPRLPVESERPLQEGLAAMLRLETQVRVAVVGRAPTRQLRERLAAPVVFTVAVVAVAAVFALAAPVVPTVAPVESGTASSNGCELLAVTDLVHAGFGNAEHLRYLLPGVALGERFFD